MLIFAQIAAWFATSKTGRMIAAGAALALGVGIAVLKVFSAGKESQRLKDENQAQRETLDAVTEQKEISDASRTMSGDALDRDNSRWLRK